MKVLKNNFYLILIFFVILTFFFPFFLKGLLPIPTDTIVGLYHPFRDFYAKDYPRGIPFKNFLITDPVRQQIPWKSLAISQFANGVLPAWNPYEMAGKPLLGNFQAGVFYPLNIILFIQPFYFSWSLFLFLQPVLGGIFLYLFLKNLKLDPRAIFLGVLSFLFSGFFIAWLEWGNIIHTVLWLPLILLSIDKSIYHYSNLQNSKLERRKLIIWFGVMFFSLIFSFFAGHLQIFLYILLMFFAYFLFRWCEHEKSINLLLLFLNCILLAILITAVQWIPTFQFIKLSARNLDQVEWRVAGWFIPWQNLIQFFAPDFFGNPTTLNYWGVWNYAELTGYIGIIPLIMALYALFFRHDRNTLFFGTFFFFFLLFALPTFFAKLPYQLHIPFLSSTQPTRLLSLTDFSLSVLTALGFDYFIRTKNKKQILYPLGFILLAVVELWVFVLYKNDHMFHVISSQDVSITKHNLILPTILFSLSAFLFIGLWLLEKRRTFTLILCGLIVGVIVFDLLRFAWKFETFSKKEYFYPSTKTIEFLQHQKGVFRIASFDSRILPPNFATYYKLQSIEGYDPLYLLSYGEFAAASERGKPDISSPFGFNRIITPHNIDSPFFDLLNVKYVLTLSALHDPKYKEVFAESQTRVYENLSVLPRAFFVRRVVGKNDKSETIKFMFKNDMRTTAVIDAKTMKEKEVALGRVDITNYDSNRIIIRTNNTSEGFLVLSDAYYPSWNVLIDEKPTVLYKTDYTFRGVFVPAGIHEITFYTHL